MIVIELPKKVQLLTLYISSECISIPTSKLKHNYGISTIHKKK